MVAPNRSASHEKLCVQEVIKGMDIKMLGDAVRSELTDREIFVLTALFGLDDGLPKTQREVGWGSF